MRVTKLKYSKILLSKAKLGCYFPSLIHSYIYIPSPLVLSGQNIASCDQNTLYNIINTDLISARQSIIRYLLRQVVVQEGTKGQAIIPAAAEVGDVYSLKTTHTTAHNASMEISTFKRLAREKMSHTQIHTMAVALTLKSSCKAAEIRL